MKSPIHKNSLRYRLLISVLIISAAFVFPSTQPAYAEENAGDRIASELPGDEENADKITSEMTGDENDEESHISDLIDVYSEAEDVIKDSPADAADQGDILSLEGDIITGTPDTDLYVPKDIIQTPESEDAASSEKANADASSEKSAAEITNSKKKTKDQKKEAKKLPITHVHITYKSMRYNGRARTQNTKTQVYYKDQVLKAKRDYTITYRHNVKAGVAEMKVTGIGKYCGTIVRKFSIKPVPIKTAKLEFQESWYTGTAIKPAATVTASVDHQRVILTKGKDYKVSYKNNKNEGTATVTITGKGNFTGTIKKTFQIKQTSITGSGTSRTITFSTGQARYASVRMAVWTESRGQNDLTWYTMSRKSPGVWTAAAEFENLKMDGKVNVHIYGGSKVIHTTSFIAPRNEWMEARSRQFKREFLHGHSSSIDFVQAARNIAWDNSIGYGHTWLDGKGRRTISCAGLVNLTLTYCGYGDLIKDDPSHAYYSERAYWGYLDLGSYAKYNWRSVMEKELGAVWMTDFSQLRPGDILYYDYGIYNNHVAIYVGNGVTVEARGPAGASRADEGGGEVAHYTNWPSLPWQGFYRLPHLHYNNW